MTRITTKFNATTTAAEVARRANLRGRRAIVTGAASGIGIETARALAMTGADVTLAVRNVAAGERVAEDIARTTGNHELHVAQLDLADRESIARFSDNWWGPLHVLVNNAGVMATPELHTYDGHELQFATNHLGHFALALGLQEALAVDGNARIVSVSSSAHARSPVVFDDIDYAEREYDPVTAYGQSKTANVLFAVEANRRWARDGITANALMPGVIETNLQRHIDPTLWQGMKEAEQSGAMEPFKTVEQGAATSVLLATSPKLEGIGGRYFEDCNEAEIVPADFAGRLGVREYALDPANAERLWEVSLEMLESQLSAAA